MNIKSPKVQGSIENLQGKILRTRHGELLKENISSRNNRCNTQMKLQRL